MNKYLIIEQDVIDQIALEAIKNKWEKEIGGLFLGFRKDEHLHIVKATLPAPLDIRSRYKFIRQDPHHQQIATHEWQHSENKMDWLGEWHTHPEYIPVPSSVDLDTWRRITKKRQSPMVFSILGMSNRLTWVCLPDSLKVIEVPLDFSAEAKRFFGPLPMQMAKVVI